MLVFVINCLVTSSICCLIKFVILFAVVELSVFLFSIKSAEAWIPSLTFVGVPLVVLSCNRN